MIIKTTDEIKYGHEECYRGEIPECNKIWVSLDSLKAPLELLLKQSPITSVIARDCIICEKKFIIFHSIKQGIFCHKCFINFLCDDIFIKLNSQENTNDTNGLVAVSSQDIQETE